jgi:hypothetical protein
MGAAVSKASMRRFVSFIVSTAVHLVILTAAGSGQQQSRRIAGKCGRPVSGIALCLSHSAEPRGGTLEVRNTGPKDAVLNLGVMLANGARQYATAITLVLTDAEGKQHHAELAEPTGVIAGRLDPFIVPLPSGASLELLLRISEPRPWYASGDLEDFEPDRKKHYRVQAQFTGKGVSQRDANLDVKGIALMPYWTGVVVSNTVAIGPK